MSKPSKASGARAQPRAGSGASEGTRRKTSKSRTKADLEQELAELKQVNAELREQVRREQERARRLEQINQQAGERIESVIGRIKTLLAS